MRVVETRAVLLGELVLLRAGEGGVARGVARGTRGAKIRPGVAPCSLSILPCQYTA